VTSDVILANNRRTCRLAAFANTPAKRDMLHNDILPHIEVDAQTHKVFADGKLLHVESATRVPSCRKYLLR